MLSHLQTEVGVEVEAELGNMFIAMKYNYICEGCMYRGPPPHGRLRSIPRDDQQAMKIVNMATVHVGDFMEFIEKNYIDEQTKKLTVTIRLEDSSPFSYLTLIDVSRDGTNFSLNRKDTPTEIQENDETFLTLSVNENRYSTFCCIFPTTKYGGPGIYRSKVISFPTTGDVLKFKFQFSHGEYNMQQNVEIPLKFKNIHTKIGDASFKIEPVQFSDCIIPSEIEELWGPIPMEKLPDGVDNTCLAVTHKICGNYESRKPVNVHILHSLPLCMSAVQVTSTIYLYISLKQTVCIPNFRTFTLRLW